MTPQKPTRSTTRQAAANKATGGTRRATGAQRAPTGHVRVPGGKKSNTGLVIGACVGGGVLLIVLLAVALGGGKKERPTETEAGPSKEKTPVNVRELVETGMRDCEEGYSVIQSCKSAMDSTSQSPAEKQALKEKLQKGVNLIDKGMRYLEQADQKSGGNSGADPKREWGMARKMANNYIANLGK